MARPRRRDLTVHADRSGHDDADRLSKERNAAAQQKTSAMRLQGLEGLQIT